ncbi:DUF4856 domain-containing protein [Ornithobacterium rhinotracheale]|uniref:DUF4856 domain-containing protein n=1 Tax=Ornithobacterium rhinotracheale TaxID=28251 RepID=UPI00129C4D0C|nr:DUF4856 domain-containing protein [Ornithobacterium rhinotracheale]MRJ08401.1 DUF4856 domain-containing protein [Ornithobacterium rhinotracheale]UOH77594.1 DUF4856 domain-containing protein [Ornithobacterium rhinotracheale]
MKKSIILALVASFVAFTSCNSNDDENNQVDPSIKKETVSATDADLFNKELKNLKSNPQFQAGSENVKKAAEINAMFGDNTPEQLVEKFKTISPYVGQSKQFEQWLQKSKENQKVVAVDGKAGYLGKRIVDAKGVETFMLYKKGITGGLQIHNISDRVLKIKAGKDVQANLNELLGYLLGVDDFTLATNKEGKYKLIVNNDENIRPKNELLRYINQVSENPKTPILANIVSAVNVATKQGVDSKKLNASLDVISESVAKILALRATHYFDEYSDDLKSDEKRVTAVHEMSEGLGFVYGLQFTYNPKTGKPYFTNEEVLNYINSVNFWKAEEAKTKLSNLANELAKRLNFDRKDA